MTTSNKTSQTVDAFVAFLRQSHKRITPERLSIAEIISRQATLFGIDDIETQMSKEAYPVALATLYNTIELLLEAGLLSRIKLPERQNALYRLSGGEPSHVYLICRQCGHIKETHSKALIKYIKQYDFPTFTPTDFTLHIQGLCNKCRRITKTDKHLKTTHKK